MLFSKAACLICAFLAIPVPKHIYTRDLANDQIQAVQDTPNAANGISQIPDAVSSNGQTNMPSVAADNAIGDDVNSDLHSDGDDQDADNDDDDSSSDGQ